ncbi:hypothetical protein EYF80_034291 [Liparis tanakae]|uniref:Uncharacterized protein n=1 Tax=Liparis tanakae TaxID=230148 RepID=A0A4Z2GQA3_9TELE|nr:hypothetical protein EYF80_034291 [Liparis tanakae]
MPSEDDDPNRRADRLRRKRAPCEVKRCGERDVYGGKNRSNSDYLTMTSRVHSFTPVNGSDHIWDAEECRRDVGAPVFGWRWNLSIALSPAPKR